MVDDCGLDNLLKCWTILDNHDAERLRHMLPNEAQRRIAEILQFTVPGSPCVYYGTELGMDGGSDPENRAPMRWDLDKNDNKELQFVKKLIKLRKDNRALRVGEFRALDTEKLMAFARFTEKPGESIIVAVNPSDKAVKETFSCRNGRALNYTDYKDLFDGKAFTVIEGLLTVEVPAMSARVMKLQTGPLPMGYTQYKRMN